MVRPVPFHHFVSLITVVGHSRASWLSSLSVVSFSVCCTHVPVFWVVGYRISRSVTVRVSHKIRTTQNKFERTFLSGCALIALFHTVTHRLALALPLCSVSLPARASHWNRAAFSAIATRSALTPRSVRPATGKALNAPTVFCAREAAFSRAVERSGTQGRSAEAP